MRKSAKELNVQLCDGFELDEEILVNYTEKGKQVMILDLGVNYKLEKCWIDWTRISKNNKVSSN